jgi:hypothetical protein
MNPYLLLAWNNKMAAKTVNLDALIPREDFLTEEGPSLGESDKKSATTTDLIKGESFYSSLRKPDFQRETAVWTPGHIVALVKAFVEGDLIPSVICWQSPARLSFVIDGAHRLSAIIAWISDDYGAGDISVRFYNNQIPEEQRKIHERTRSLIAKEIGHFKDIKAESASPGSNPNYTGYARALAHSGIQLQWLKKAESEKAEEAFFTINQSAVKIDNTELKILNTRFKPNAIIARAIVRNATGHKYWDVFSTDAVAEIERLSKEINTLLFTPPLITPVHSIELPIAGHGYGSQPLPLIFELINLANNIPVEDASKYKKLKVTRETPDEAETLRLIKNMLKLANRMTGKHPSSLGLHPAVYFYSASGRHQPTAVLAMAALIMDMERENTFYPFCDVRSNFEDFLLSHKDFVNQMTRKSGSMAKGYRLLKDYFVSIIECLKSGTTDQKEIETRLLDSDAFSFMQITKAITSAKSKDFSKNAKQKAFLDEALSAAVTCNICGARKDNKSVSADHIRDKKHGGLPTTDNLQLVHPFCNSAYKKHSANANN